MNRDVCFWTKTCVPSQRSQILRGVQFCSSRISTDNGPFSHIYLDIVGPLPPADGSCLPLKCVAPFTHWPMAVPIADTSDEMVPKSFLHHWISKSGVSSLLTADRGEQFQSKWPIDLSTLVGFKRICTTKHQHLSNWKPHSPPTFMQLDRRTPFRRPCYESTSP